MNSEHIGLGRQFGCSEKEECRGVTGKDAREGLRHGSDTIAVPQGCG